VRVRVRVRHLQRMSWKLGTGGCLPICASPLPRELSREHARSSAVQDRLGYLQSSGEHDGGLRNENSKTGNVAVKFEAMDMDVE
jgi:hypothetical protein